ncbi:MAG: DNA-directed RNA polymerase subunit alpha [Candidatus Moranbacteria bacterium]|nr:DNA-directed RNA polymerase subunit alpha [Candidatus Moranbacteria bacterium]
MKTIALPQKPKYVKGDDFEAVFEIKGCYPGYGNTLGNALRRVLLSSLPGYAITKIKIKDVDHEFATIPGIKENVVQIILNLKKLRFKMHREEPVKIKLSVSGAREITASDLKMSSNIESIDKKAPIATITDAEGKLEMEMTVEKGIGYSPIEGREEDTKELGTIAVDALFTPIEKINYSVENMRVGKRTDYDKISFMIRTDGSIKPEEAFKEASKILVKQFAVLAETEEKKLVQEVQQEIKSEQEDRAALKVEEAQVVEGKKKSKTNKVSAKKQKKKVDKKRLSVDDLNLSKRILAILKDNKLDTVGKVAKKSEEELMLIEGMGEKAIKDIKKAIGVHGIILKEEKD